ncbi:MAG: protein kinase domain-containing protein [Nocardioides sp.]
MDVASKALGSNYELVSLIGTGAMGEVWRALDRSTGGEVAAKVLRSEYSNNPEIVGRFIQERSILLALDDPGIVAVRDLVVERDRLAIIMDLVEGQDLRGALRSAGTLPPALAARVTARILEALSAAHSQGALHRDVKPDNVLLTSAWESAAPGSVRLSDFSIARLAQESTVQATGLLGTPEYMPPELFEHGTSSTASDVYAAGVVLYELLAGRTPFAGEGTAFTIGNRAVTVEPPRLAVPEPLWLLVTALLAKDPRRRPKAVDGAAALLELATALADVRTLPVQPPPTTWRRTGAADLERATIHPEPGSATFDAGVTNLDGVLAPAPAVPQTGEVQALVPAAAPQLEPGVTNVGSAGVDYHAPVLQPAVEKVVPVDAGGRRGRALLLPGGALLLVAVLVAGWLVLRPSGGGHSRGPQASADAVTAGQDDDRVGGSGLGISRSAVWDPATHEMKLTISLEADRVPLQGPFLQVLPMPKGATDCPLPVWDGAQGSANDIEATGVTAACGYSFDAPVVPAGQTRKVVATFALDLGEGDPQQLAQSWLDQAASATKDALANTGADNTAYAAQRLMDVAVAVEPANATVRTRQLRVSVYPVWPTGEDRLHPLFVSSATDTTTLLDQVAGGRKSLRLFAGCESITVNRDLTVSPVHQTPDCSVFANVANLTEVESNHFTITGTLS